MRRGPAPDRPRAVCPYTSQEQREGRKERGVRGYTLKASLQQEVRGEVFWGTFRLFSIGSDDFEPKEETSWTQAPSSSEGRGGNLHGLSLIAEPLVRRTKKKKDAGRETFNGEEDYESARTLNALLHSRRTKLLEREL